MPDIFGRKGRLAQGSEAAVVATLYEKIGRLIRKALSHGELEQTSPAHAGQGLQRLWVYDTLLIRLASDYLSILTELEWP